MVEPRYDPASKKFVFPKEEAKAAGKPAPTDMVYMAIPKATVVTLSGLAVKDGAAVNAETEKGKDIQRSKLARLYVLQAVADLIAARQGR